MQIRPILSQVIKFTVSDKGAITKFPDSYTGSPGTLLFPLARIYCYLDRMEKIAN